MRIFGLVDFWIEERETDQILNREMGEKRERGIKKFFTTDLPSQGRHDNGAQRETISSRFVVTDLHG
jgi:hypothetical protein